MIHTKFRNTFYPTFLCFLVKMRSQISRIFQSLALLLFTCHFKKNTDVKIVSFAYLLLLIKTMMNKTFDNFSIEFGFLIKYDPKNIFSNIQHYAVRITNYLHSIPQTLEPLDPIVMISLTMEKNCLKLYTEKPYIRSTISHCQTGKAFYGHLTKYFGQCVGRGEGN